MSAQPRGHFPAAVWLGGDIIQKVSSRRAVLRPLRTEGTQLSLQRLPLCLLAKGHGLLQPAVQASREAQKPGALPRMVALRPETLGCSRLPTSRSLSGRPLLSLRILSRGLGGTLAKGHTLPYLESNRLFSNATEGR